MPETRLGPARLATIVALSVLTIGLGLGSSGRLTYHEAFVAQAAREMIADGSVLVPTVDGQPWLEKPPLSIWMVATTGKIGGGVSEIAARAPSALMATLMVLGVATFASRRFGPNAGWLAGLIQVTTAWTIMRGRLAEADVTLACLVTWAFVAIDRVRADPPALAWRWAFFGLVGASSMVKGLGFGAALILSATVVVMLWDRDRSMARRMISLKGWGLAAGLALTWPLLVAWRHPEAISLWSMHVTDRMASKPEVFIGGPWWQYGPAVLLQAMPWTPLALMGAWPSIRRAWRDRGGPDRLLWAWAVVPVLVLSMATVKNAHYAIHAMPPWSIWAALGLIKIGAWLESCRGWSPMRVRRATAMLFGGLGLVVGLGYAVVGPRLDRRGQEWASCESIGRDLDPRLPLVILYEDYDRKPYPTPFGPVPHDWAVRLFYLRRPASWRQGVEDLAARPPGTESYALLARDRDLPALKNLGRVETIRKGPAIRFDRTFTLFRVTPGGESVAIRQSPR